MQLSFQDISLSLTVSRSGATGSGSQRPVAKGCGAKRAGGLSANRVYDFLHGSGDRCLASGYCLKPLKLQVDDYHKLKRTETGFSYPSCMTWCYMWLTPYIRVIEVSAY
jgi:hypothetical protein